MGIDSAYRHVQHIEPVNFVGVKNGMNFQAGEEPFGLFAPASLIAPEGRGHEDDVESTPLVT